MSETEDKPITVNASALPDQAMTAVRSLLLAGVSWAVGRGYLDAAAGSQLVAGLVVLLPMGWNLYVSTRKHTKALTMAEASPNYVAVVKS